MGSTGYAEKTIIFRGASMKNLKKKVHFRIKLKSKHLLVIMSIFCVSCIAATFSSGVTTAPLQDAAGILFNFIPQSTPRQTKKLQSTALKNICPSGTLSLFPINPAK